MRVPSLRRFERHKVPVESIQYPSPPGMFAIFTAPPAVGPIHIGKIEIIKITFDFILTCASYTK